MQKVSLLFKRKVEIDICSKRMMANILILKITILACIFLGGLFAIIATAVKEWQKFENSLNSFNYQHYGYSYYDYSSFYDYFDYSLGSLAFSEKVKQLKIGLWEYCTKKTIERAKDTTTCESLNDLLRYFESSMKGNYFFI